MATPSTTPTNNPVPSTSMQDLLFNAELLDIIVNGSQEDALSRLGANIITIEGIKQIAIGPLLVAVEIYETVADGLAASVDDAYFYVEGAAQGVALTLYQRTDATTARKVADQPSIEATEQISIGEGVSIDSYDGMATFEIIDNNDSAFSFVCGIREILRINTKDDVVSTSTIEADVVKGSTYDNAVDFTTTQTIELSATRLTDIADANGRSVLKIDPTSETITTNYKINQNQEGRPIYVAVEEGPITYSSAADRAPYDVSLRPYQGTPTIAITGSRIWMSWRADLVVGENPGNFLVVAYSDDDGATFTETDIITYEGDPMYQIVDPMMWVSPEGILYLWYGVYGKNQGQDGVCSFWAQTCKNPESEFRSWSKSFRMSYFGDPRHATLINEEYWIPVDTWKSNALYPPAYPSKTGPRICKLDYRERIARPISRLPPNYNDSYSGFFETEIVQLSDGRIMATNRLPTVGLVRCFSDDNGETWTDFEDYTPILGDVSSSRIWLGTTPSGRLVICYNNDNARRTLTVALSEDDGESFPYTVVLDQDLNSQRSYPVLDFDGDSIYVVYDNEREANARIRIAKVLESEIVAGTSDPIYHTVSQP